MRRWVGMFLNTRVRDPTPRGRDAAAPLAGRRASQHALPGGAAAATARRSPSRGVGGGGRATAAWPRASIDSRWMVSTYGKEPFTPTRRRATGTNVAAEREGSPLALSMVDGGGEVDDAADLDEDDADAPAPVATAAETNQPAVDPLGNISKVWEEEEEDDDARLADGPRAEDDALKDWAGTAAATALEATFPSRRRLIPRRDAHR